MSFATPSSVPRSASIDPPEVLEIEQSWWPDIDAIQAREIVRINGTVTDIRLFEALQTATYSINRELQAWRDARQAEGIDELVDPRAANLYLRAVYFHAKAELIERYRDFDSTASGDRRGEEMYDAAADARRYERWAVSELLGRPRLTVELM